AGGGHSTHGWPRTSHPLATTAPQRAFRRRGSPSPSVVQSPYASRDSSVRSESGESLAGACGARAPDRLRRCTARPIACAYSPPKFRRRILFQPFLFGAQALACEERRIEQATEIKRSAIAEQRDDGMPGTYFAGDAYRCGDVDARRAAHEEPFVA